MKNVVTSSLIALAACAVLASPASSVAGPDAATLSDLDEGRVLRAKGDLQGARARFEAAWKARKSAVVGYELAGVLRELGRLNDAYDLLYQVSELKPSAPDEVAAQGEAAKLYAEIDAAIPMVILDLSALGDQVDKILIDGEPLPRAEWGEAQPLDPGNHEIVVVLRDGSGLKKNLTVAERARARVTFGAPKTAQPAAPQAPSACPEGAVVSGTDCVIRDDYGWQLGVADGVFTAVWMWGMTRAVVEKSPEQAGVSVDTEDEPKTGDVLPMVVGMLGFTLASPIVHWSHRRVGRGFASFGLHAGAMLGGFVLMAALSDGDTPSTSHIVAGTLGAGALAFGLDWLIIPHTTETKVAKESTGSTFSLPRIGVVPIRGGAAASLGFTF